MELSRKTTILLSPRLYSMLKSISQARHTSIGELIRSACEKQYGISSEPDALAAAERLASMNLPVGEVRAMKGQSVPAPEDLIP